MEILGRTTDILNREIEAKLPQNPTKDELKSLVQQYKSDGLCGRRIAEQHLGPYFVASDQHGQREIELLDEILNEEYAESDMCIRERQSECSRLRGGCKNA